MAAAAQVSNASEVATSPKAAVAADGPSTADFVLRPVAPCDREACAEIAAVTYGGHDYLVTAIETWMADTAKNTALCLAHPETNRLAAIENLTRIDDGETGWVEGLRTHPDWRGRGLASRLHKELVAVAVAESEDPAKPLRRLRYTTRADNLVSLRLAEAAGMSVVDSWGFAFQPLDERLCDKLDSARSPGSGGPELLHELTMEEAVAHCEGPTGDRLSTSKFVTIDWKVLQTVGRARRVLQGLRDSHGTVFAGGDGAFSLGQKRPDATTTSWFVTVYAAEDADAALRHIAWHVARAAENGATAVMLFYNEALIRELGPEGRGVFVADVFSGAPKAVMVERELRATE
ncbi:hypothetical protein FNF27_00256 [Cafeteria roenbergensis]|uniref:N-acetyltransferase domain-containing protein n=1 Tax=Cafeteria roenbergensis TaxID=33653 RepID=A0A5A8EP08_CAFRO|nr:hypothetical protein FNF27_00256 [Cafeteria roenbergensis]